MAERVSVRHLAWRPMGDRTGRRPGAAATITHPSLFPIPFADFAGVGLLAARALVAP